MAKRTCGYRMRRAKARARVKPRGRGRVRRRAAGRRIMRTGSLQ